MKTKLLLVVLALVAISVPTSAQEDCNVTLSIFSESAKVKNYDAALPIYKKLIEKCPATSMATYQYGEQMFKHYIKNSDGSQATEYAKDLIKNYELRLEHFPAKTKKGDYLSKIAQVEFDNNIGTKEEEFNHFAKAWKEDKENFNSPKALYTYFSLMVDLYDAGKKELQEVFDLYDGISEKIENEEGKLAKQLSMLSEKEEAGTTLTSKEKRTLKNSEIYLNNYDQVSGGINGKLGQRADCENLIPLYEKDFENKKTDVEWLRRAAGRLNSKDCEDPLFFKLVQALHNVEPSAESALYLGVLANRDGKRSTALDYYNQAADLQTDESKKADIYGRMAGIYKKQGSYGKARTYYQKQLAIKPSKGEAYLQIANMYALSANNCGNTVFEKRSVYWLAADYAARAARVKPSLKSTANQSIANYRAKAPSKADIFQENMAGKTINIGCWIGEKIRVPNL
ncbi:hypothetical protein [Gangjinia marincola]